jgi:acetate kinase
LDIKLDDSANQRDSEDQVHRISTSDSKIAVYRVLTDEELECAQLALSV